MRYHNINMHETTRYIIKLLLQGIAGVVLMSVGFILVAGRYDYVQGWMLICFYALFTPVMFYVFRDKQDIIKEKKTWSGCEDMGSIHCTNL